LRYSVIYKDIGLKDYKETWDFQADIFNELVDRKKLRAGDDDFTGNLVPGTMIFVEHPHVYTLGKSGSENNLLLDSITYHGPGQIVGYPIFDLEVIEIGLKEYIHGLEEAIIRTVGEFGIIASRLEGGTGVWLDPDIKDKARKICAIGVKASRYITMHGFAFNVNTDLTYFNNINPCGFKDKGVTSLEKELGMKQDLDQVKSAVKRNLQEIFNLDWTNK
jgi:lipoyl(octanoyl) transferase